MPPTAGVGSPFSGHILTHMSFSIHDYYLVVVNCINYSNLSCCSKPNRANCYFLSTLLFKLVVAVVGTPVTIGTTLPSCTNFHYLLSLSFSSLSLSLSNSLSFFLSFSLPSSLFLRLFPSLSEHLSLRRSAVSTLYATHYNKSMTKKHY